MTGSRKVLGAGAALLLCTLLLVPLAAPEAVAEPNMALRTDPKLPPVSGVVAERTATDLAEPGAEAQLRAVPDNGAWPTDCPQAGLERARPQPLSGTGDALEVLSGQGDDIRLNQDFSCFPQNETSIAVSPANGRNVVGGANDYRLGGSFSGFYATTDGGGSWYDGLIPVPSLPTTEILDSAGDPIVAFDRSGTVYFAGIAFNRTDDAGGIFVSRSTNGGFTWTRPCVPGPGEDPADDQAVCVAPADPRQPGDGVVVFTPDDDAELNFSVPFDDKPWMTVGPRPEGVEATCFGPETRAPVACAAGTVSPDRIYVTWTRFADDAQILMSYSDDGARSWSEATSISGAAPFCVSPFPDAPPSDACNINQFSVPTVSPATGELFVAWQNFNTEDETQYLSVRSSDGGASFSPPRFVTSVYSSNYPFSGSPADHPLLNRPDCAARGTGIGIEVLTNSCFRVNSAGNVVVDRRGGAFADDLYLVLSDNRNGTRESTNTDVFLFSSTDGGETWVGPTRVNDDQSRTPSDRDCPTGSPGCKDVFGNDQWYPWVDINTDGALNVVFSDRRLDTTSTATEWPESRTRPGNYLAWLFGAQCTIAAAGDCTAGEAQVITQPEGPVNPGPGPQPGQGQQTFPLANFTVSNVPSNYDYSFRAGIFAGDYNTVAVTADEAFTLWTDARNGRSSRNQPGRNPACEQSDVFADRYPANRAGTVEGPRRADQVFAQAECPA